MGTHKVKQCVVREKNILYWLTAKTKDKNHLYWHDEPNEPTKEGPFFHLYSISPHLPQIQQSAGATTILWSKIHCWVACRQGIETETQVYVLYGPGLAELHWSD